MTTLAVFGSANMDLVIPVDRLPAPGETRMGSDLMTVFGGKGANQAVAAARLGATVEFIGAVGDDVFGRRYRDHLREEGIGTDFVGVAAGRPTGCAMILVEKSSQNMIVVSPGANHTITPDDVDRAVDAIRRADLVTVQLEIPLETVRRVIQIANREQRPVLLNPSPVDSRFSLEGLSVDYLVLNTVEAEQLSGIVATCKTTTTQLMDALVSRGAGHVVLTRGKESTVVSNGDRLLEAPTFPVVPVDTVGAGDTFAGAFATAIAEGMELHAAATFANCAAGLSTLKMGAQSSMPKRQDVEDAIQRNAQ